jgi:hypothetical protein
MVGLGTHCLHKWRRHPDDTVLLRSILCRWRSPPTWYLSSHTVSGPVIAPLHTDSDYDLH